MIVKAKDLSFFEYFQFWEDYGIPYPEFFGDETSYEPLQLTDINVVMVTFGLVIWNTIFMPT